MTDVGERVLGRYRIEAKIAEGAMGVVYRAFDERLACPVALKGLRGTRLDDPEFRQRLLREARAAAALRRHPHVVTVHEIHDEGADGRLWISMDLIDGPSLRDRIHAGGAMRPEAVARVVREVGAALSAAHRRGLVHRDVKPENVLFDAEGAAYLCDFGIVKSYGPEGGPEGGSWSTHEDYRPGTPPYMSPELVLVGDASPASDQFALAVTAFEALTGRLPWGEGENLSAVRVFAAVLHDEVPAVSSLRPGLPRGVDLAIARATAKDPGARYPDVDAFVDALAGALEVASGTPTAISSSGPAAAADGASRASDTSSTGGRRPSTPGGVLLGGLVAVAALAAIVFVAWGGRSDDRRERSIAAAGAIEGDVACPVFEALEGSEPQHWLGAAAGDETCRRLALLFGGRRDAALRPAELLRLDRAPDAAALVDPFDVPRARETSLARARSMRRNLVDGSVRWTAAEGFTLRLDAWAGGRRLGSAEARAEALHLAVGEALRALEQAGHLRRADALDPDVRDFDGVPDIDTALFARDLTLSAIGGVDAVRLCEEAALRGAEAGPAVSGADDVCDAWLERAGREPREWPAPVMPTREGPRLSWHARLGTGPCADDPGGCFRKLERFRRGERDPYRLSRYAFAQGRVAREVDPGRLPVLFAEAERGDPSFCAAHEYALLEQSLAPASKYWTLVAACPSLPSAWAVSSEALGADDPPSWSGERAYRLGPFNGYLGLRLAEAALSAAHDDPSRLAVAARVGERYLAGPRWLRLAGAYVKARLLLRGGELGAARDLLWEELRTLPRFGYAVFGDVEALELFLRLELEVFEADPGVRLVPFLERIFADPEARLRLEPPYFRLPLLSTCIRVGGETLAACLEMLAALPASAKEVLATTWAPCLEGARRALADDPTAAADAWWTVRRRPVDAPHRRCGVPSRSFDAAGQHERAAELDARRAEGRDFHGIDPALVSMADRAFDAGDCAAGRALAARVAAAWGPTSVDVRLPVVSRLEGRAASCR